MNVSPWHSALDLLCCPHCGAALRREESAVRCTSGHSFDLARQGYLNLVGDGRRSRGDSPGMVEARAAFLAAGHFRALSDAVAGECARVAEASAEGCVLELGAGTGAYLAAALNRLPGHLGLALDSSPAALRRSARAHPRAVAVGCDAWATLPVRSGAVAVALNVFAPRNGAEFARVLHPRGGLVTVTPTPRHLQPLVDALGLLAVDPDKDERLDRGLAPGLRPERRELCERALQLGHGDVSNLVAMGPSARHFDPGALEKRLRELPEPLEVTLSAAVAVYRPAPPG